MASSVVGPEVSWPTVPRRRRCRCSRSSAVSVVRSSVVSVDAGGHAGVRAGAHAVVAVELLLLLRREVAVGVDLRGVLHLVLADGYADAVVGQVGVPDRDEGLLRAEQAGADGDPLGLAGLVVEVDLGGRADLLAGLVVDVLADHAARWCRCRSSLWSLLSVHGVLRSLRMGDRGRRERNESGRSDTLAGRRHGDRRPRRLVCGRRRALRLRRSRRQRMAHNPGPRARARVRASRSRDASTASRACRGRGPGASSADPAAASA